MIKTSQRKQKKQEAEGEISKNDIKTHLKNLEDERAALLEAAGANKEALRTQINRIKETIDKVLKKHHSPGKTENIIQRTRYNDSKYSDSSWHDYWCYS